MNSVFYSSTLPQMLNVSTFYKAPKEVFASPLSAGFFKITVTYMYIMIIKINIH